MKPVNLLPNLQSAYAITSRSASGPSTRMDVVIPSITAGRIVLENLCLLWMASSDHLSTISNPRQTEARKKARKGGSFGLMKACPHRTGCQAKRAEAASAADGLTQRAL